MNNNNAVATIEECNITIDNSQNNSVDARALHEFLEVGTRFNGWITGRIKQYGFVENEDFVTFAENPVKLGRPSKEYAVSLDMAKELSMVENNNKGREARRYFIQCEKDLKEKLCLALDVSEEARKEAVRARGKISNNREATAVGKTGGLTTSNNALRTTISELELDKESSRQHMGGLVESLTKYREAKPTACYIPKERPSDIKRYHVEELIQLFAYATKREKQEVRNEVYGIFNKRAIAKGFNIFQEAKRQNVAIIEAIRRRGLMDKLYDIVMKCMEEFNNLIPKPEEPHNDFSESAKSRSFTGIK